MKDRIPTKPNRYAVYDDAHNFLRYEYHERADEPTQEGDALNKANLLPDDVAAALGLTGNPQVKDALEVINDSFVDTRKCWWEKYSLQMIYEASIGSYATRNIGWNIGGDPSEELYTGYTINQSTGAITPTGKTTITISSGTDLSNYYCYPYIGSTLDKETTLYKCSGAASIPSTATFRACQCAPVTAVQTDIKGAYVNNVSSYSVDGYPANGAQGGYWYVSIGRAPLIATQITTGSYTGTGTFGSDHPNSIVLGFEPKTMQVWWLKEGYEYRGSGGNCISKVLLSALPNNDTYQNVSVPSATSVSDKLLMVKKSSDGKTVSWYSTNSANEQCNIASTSYCYCFIG